MGVVLWDWVDMGVRWLHVITGIAWIGSSFYFVHLDQSLKRREHLPDGAGGEAWQVHGGGFYHMVKYVVAPARMPEDLTWFKWEAYATWLSGFALLTIVYYLGAELYLIDRNVLDLPVWAAVAISVATLAAGWAGYHYLCESPIGADDTRLALAVAVAIAALAFAFGHVFSARGAYMQIGSVIGTIMVANVFMIIIPNQRKVVDALVAGRTPDPRLGAQAKQRSLHNNYLTLPVLFVMISNHYPLAYATRFSWLILAFVLVMGVVIRHFYNTRHKGLPSPWWTWGVAAACAAAIVFLSTFRPAETEAAAPPSEPVTFAQAEEIVLSRCSMCHAAEPGWEGITVPPKGVVLETPEQIRLQAHEIGVNAAYSHAMPPGNVTEMTPEERQALAAWLAAGAPGG